MIDIDVLRKQYTLSDGSYNIEKIFLDLSFWLDFNEEYHLEKLGGMMFLRSVLGDPSEFLEKYLPKQ